VGNLKRKRHSQTEKKLPSQILELNGILVPARSTNSLSKGMECVDEKRTDSELQRVISIETDDRNKFIAPSWRAIEKCRHWIFRKVSSHIIEASHFVPADQPSTSRSWPLHGGTQLTLRTLRQWYWIVGYSNLIKAHIGQCVIYARQAAKNRIQLMGDLSSPRANLSSPLLHTGVDYAGPFGIISYMGRGQRKHYMALFVCLATKAGMCWRLCDY